MVIEIPAAVRNKAERAGCLAVSDPPTRRETRSVAHLGLVALVVDDHDDATACSVDALGLELIEDEPALTNDGRPERWVVVRPVGAETGLPLARADGDRRRERIGDQTGGRASFLYQVDDFDAAAS